MAKKKAVPPVYPKRRPIRLTPEKIVAVEVKKGKLVGITVDGPPPPELLAAAEREQRRMNLTGRLNDYVKFCGLKVYPHCGERPAYISQAKWADFNQRVRVLSELSETAPAEAHDALLAIQTITKIADELAKVSEYPDAVNRAICWAIDLGQLLQRIHVQIEFGEAVDGGKRSVERSKTGNRTKSEAKESKSAQAEAEFIRRMAKEKRKGMKQATLRNMSDLKDTNGNRIFPPFSTLKKWAATWPSYATYE